MALTLEKKIRNCITSLNLSQEEAGNILIAEFMRIAYDERYRDNKGIIIQVKDDIQKVIAESMAQAYMEKATKTPLCQSGKGIVQVRVGNNLAESEDPVNVINLENFDFKTEEKNLLARYDDTIIANAKIKDYLIKVGIPTGSKPNISGYQSEISDLEAKIKKVTGELVGYQVSFFSVFKEKKIRDCQEEINSLKGRLAMLQEKQKKYNAYENKGSNENSRRIRNLTEKEENMKAIKFIFTGKRESLVKNIDTDGKVSYKFVLDENQQDNSEKKRR
jgi:hypothetical protein